MLISSSLFALAVGQELLGVRSALRSGDRIDFFGDSITWQGGFLDVLADRIASDPRTRGLGVSLIKRGINGGKSADLVDGCQNLYGCTQAPFAQVIRADRPNAIVVMIGINDVWHGAKGNPPDVYEKRLRQLVASAKAARTPIVLATPTIIGELARGSNPLDAQLDAYAKIVKKVATETGAIAVDVRGPFFKALEGATRVADAKPDRGVLTYDGVHMLPAGNRILADAFSDALGVALAGRRAEPAPTPDLDLVPWPRSITHRSGVVTLAHPAIVATTPVAKSVAAILARDLLRLTGVEPPIVDSPRPGAIVLRVDERLGPERYKLECSADVTITAGGVRGLNWAATTLAQLARPGLTFPRVSIDDAPATGYRGLMIDVARRYHSIATLRQIVDLCRFYRLNTLQLHLTDDQAFTFPSKAFPKLSAKPQHGGPAYTLDELKGLVAYADARGVTIVPEMDVPGHSAAMIRAMPELFKIGGTQPYEHHATINFANAAVTDAIDVLIGEMCDVFRSSPYFHMGGDEADITYADQHADFKEAFKRYGLGAKAQQEIFRHFIGQVDEMVKRRGKRLVVWEGFGRAPNAKFAIPKDVLVMEFENAYYSARDLLEDGYEVVNASWTPLYVVNRHVWPARRVFDWDLGRFGRVANLYDVVGWTRAPDIRNVPGAQVCSWEGPEFTEVQNLRRVAAALGERLWNSATAADGDGFTRRATKTDARLESLIHRVHLETTALDATDPNGFDVPCFTKPLSVRLSGPAATTIRYTLDGKEPTEKSPAYAAPITIKDSATVRAVAFRPDGTRVPEETGAAFYFVPERPRNLAGGKRVTVSGGTQGAQTPNLVVDDNLDLASSWWASPAPQWIKIDLGQIYGLRRIEVFPYWDGRRYYQYTVDLSVDGVNWTRVADRAANVTPATAKGDEIVFGKTDARFVRVNLLKCSANEGVHLVEVRVWDK